MTSASAAVKRWRAKHPEYMRDWMRAHRVPSTSGLIKTWGRWGAEYVAVREVSTLEAIDCALCGIRQADPMFCLTLAGCPHSGSGATSRRR